MTVLSTIVERIERSLYHVVRQVVVEHGYFPDIFAKTDFAIVSVDNGTKTFVITGDASALFTTGGTFIITGSTDRNTGFNPFTLASPPVFAAGDTTLVVNETVTGAVDDGNVGVLTYQDTDAGVAAFQTALDAVITDKGFAIETFGVGSPQSKKEKKIPRIVIVGNRKLMGDLGGGPIQVYSDDPLNAGKLKKEFLQPQTTNLQYDIHIISNSSKTDRIMHSIVAIAWPKRGYGEMYDEAGVRFFIRQYSYRDIPNVKEGIDERIYLYEVLDIFETEQGFIRDNIAKITEIKVEQQIGEEGDSFEPGSSPQIIT